MKPWDLERLDVQGVALRLQWIKDQLKREAEQQRELEAEVNSL